MDTSTLLTRKRTTRPLDETRIDAYFVAKSSLHNSKPFPPDSHHMPPTEQISSHVVQQPLLTNLHIPISPHSLPAVSQLSLTSHFQPTIDCLSPCQVTPEEMEAYRMKKANTFNDPMANMGDELLDYDAEDDDRVKKSKKKKGER